MKLLAKKYYVIILGAILAFAFFTRIYRITVPERYIFDEVYHAVTSKLIARNDPRAYEWWNAPVEPDTAVDWLHPPLAKYTQAVGMLIFGENVLGWRISSVFFGTFVIFLIAKLSLVLTKNHWISLLAAFLACLDGLLLAQSRIAMNDIHVAFAILLTLIVYLKTDPFVVGIKRKAEFKWLLITGILAGISIGTKWSGVFVLGPIFAYELIYLLQLLLHKKSVALAGKRLFTLLFCFVAVPALVYVLSYTHMFLQGKDLKHLWDMHTQIWWYQNNLTATHPYQSTPLQWITNQKPVWFHVDYSVPQHRADIYTQGNTALYWVGILAVIGFLLASVVKLSVASQVKKNTLLALTTAAQSPLMFTLAAYFAMWIVWIKSPRIMFFYHYTPAVPFLVILVAWFLVKLSKGTKVLHKQPAEIVCVIIVGLIVLNFVVFFPHWTAIPMPTSFVDKVYFYFSSWK